MSHTRKEEPNKKIHLHSNSFGNKEYSSPTVSTKQTELICSVMFIVLKRGFGVGKRISVSCCFCAFSGTKINATHAAFN